MKKFILCAVTIFSVLTVHIATALDLELTQGTNAALPVGVEDFAGDANGAAVAAVIANDLRLSGQFRLINARGGKDVSVAEWRSLGADSAVNGRVMHLGSGKYEVKFALYDVAAQGHLLLSKTYTVADGDLRALAHHISDEVYQKLTGERGVFSTRIAYILVQRNGKNARFTLKVADVDGHNPRSLLVSSEPIMSPSWSPDGKKIAYVSFEKKKSQVYIVNVASGSRQLVTNFSGINGAPAWSPDGRQLAVVLSKGGAPNIYSVNLQSGSITQLTFGKAIDTEPRYSPDGRTLLFTSGRGGAPQIYRLALDSLSVSRVTFDGAYNARASYTPNQRQIVMLHKDNNAFHIGVQDVGGSRISAITATDFDESPSVSPNGRLVLYATKYNNRGVLGMASIDGKVQIRLPAPEGDVQEPAWSPYLG